MMMMMMMMIFFSLTCYKQVLISLRRTPGPGVAGDNASIVGNRFLVSAAPATRGTLGACGSGWLTCTSSIGWSGDRCQVGWSEDRCHVGWSEDRRQVVSGPETGVTRVVGGRGLLFGV